MKNEYDFSTRSFDYGPPPENTDKYNIEDRTYICALENFFAYYFQYVFIIKELVGFRLAVIHHGKVKTNEFFPTLEAAKNAFADIYNKKAWDKSVIPKWTPLYEPDNDWLIGKQIMLKNDIIKKTRIEKVRKKTAPGKFKIRIGKMPDFLETVMLSNASEFNLKYFAVTRSTTGIFFFCVTKNADFITEEVESIQEAIDYFNDHYGKSAKPPVKKVQQWLWFVFDRKQEKQTGRKNSDVAAKIKTTSLMDALGNLSDVTEIVFL